MQIEGPCVGKSEGLTRSKFLGILQTEICSYCINLLTVAFIQTGEAILSYGTPIFKMVVSPTVLVHDVSARAGDVSIGIAVFPVGWI